MASLSRTEILINLDKAIEALSTDKVLKVGWPEKIRYENGMYVAEAAATNEYGAPHKRIPPRPFLAPTVANNKTKWLEFIKQGAKRAIRGESSILEIFDSLGVKASGDISKSIKAVTSPPLSPVTIAIRLSKYKKKRISATLTKPLIDTGIMLRSVTYSVEEES